jgi:hypothetical protein
MYLKDGDVKPLAKRIIEQFTNLREVKVHP